MRQYWTKDVKTRKCQRICESIYNLKEKHRKNRICNFIDYTHNVLGCVRKNTVSPLSQSGITMYIVNHDVMSHPVTFLGSLRFTRGDKTCIEMHAICNKFLNTRHTCIYSIFFVNMINNNRFITNNFFPFNFSYFCIILTENSEKFGKSKE